MFTFTLVFILLFSTMAYAQPTPGGGSGAGVSGPSSVMGCDSGACDELTVPSDGVIDFSGVDMSGDPVGLIPPTTTDCSANTQEGSLCWDSDNDTANFGTGSGIVTLSAGGSGDITDVMGCSTGDCSTITGADGDLLDLSSINPNTTTEGIIMPQSAAPTGNTAEGQCAWDTDDDEMVCGDSTGVVTVGPITLDEAYDKGKTIDGANSQANAVTIGDGTDGYRIYVGTGGPIIECFIGAGTCDHTINVAAGDQIFLQQDGTTVQTVDNTGVIFDLPTGDVFDVNLNSVDVLTIDEASGAAFVLPSGDTFDVTVNSVNTVSVSDTAVTVTGAVNATGELTGLVRHDDDIDPAVVLSGADCRGGLHKNNDADAIDYTLCDGETGGGQLVCFEDRAGGVITVDTADTEETITLSDGTALDAGDSVDLESGIGNGFCIFSDSSTAWHILPGAVGTVSDGGA